MSFRRYMARRITWTTSSTGAFTQTYRSDPDAPDAQNVAERLDYLRQRDVTDEVLHSARTCWDCYLRSRRYVMAARL